MSGKLKKHFIDHKDVYIAVGVTLLVSAGITTLIVRNLRISAAMHMAKEGGGYAYGQISGNVGSSMKELKNGLAMQAVPGTSYTGPVLPRQGDASSFVFSGTFTDSPITTNVYNGFRGHPGFVTRCLETGDVFKTQSDAAKAFGIDPGVLSHHLQGIYDHANGLHFERLGIAA